MPLNSFFTYTIVSNIPGHINAIIKIDPTHAIFKGHFPGNPVTPGVTQIEIVRQVISFCKKKELMLIKAKQLKYITPILPAQTSSIGLIIDYTEVPEGIAVKCTLSGEEQIFTKIRGVFSEK
jgi:3-hydroxyacyl-[acyl-carrier-protein] dehydratase